MATISYSGNGGSISSLMDLPLEIIQGIIDAAVDIVGCRKLIRLRVVNKFFAESILQAISKAPVEGSATSFSRDIITRILLWRFGRQDPTHSRFFSMVVETVNFLKLFDPNQSEQQKDRYNHALCAADVHIGDQLSFHPRQRSSTQRHEYLLKTTDPSSKASAEADRRYRIAKSPVENNAIVRLNFYVELFPVVVAAFLGDVVMIQKLLNYGVDVNAKSGFFRPALEQAAKQGNYAAVLLLLENGANPNLYDEQETFPKVNNKKAALCKACYGGYDDIVFLLLKPKYGIKPRKVTMRTAMLEAVRGGHEKLAMKLLGLCIFTDPNYLIVLHSDILLTSIEYGHEGIARRILFLDGDPRIMIWYNDILDHKDRKKDGPRTIVELASLCGRASILPLLLDNGATRTISALAHAARNGHVDVARVLLDHPQPSGLQVDTTAMLNGRHPPRKRYRTGDDWLEGIEEADFIMASFKQPPLHVASQNGEIAMVNFLLKRGANVLELWHNDRRDRNGVTALARAIEYEELEIAQMLREAGALAESI